MLNNSFRNYLLYRTTLKPVIPENIVMFYGVVMIVIDILFIILRNSDISDEQNIIIYNVKKLVVFISIMKEKIENVSNHLSVLGIKHQKEFPQENDQALMKWAAYIDHLHHAAYKAIEEQYSKFNPDASKDEQFHFFKRILAIKNVLRELQVTHDDLAESLYENSALYIYNEETISLKAKYILPELKEKKPKEIVSANFYQLLENISRNNSLSKEEFNYITSLLMQIASRPQGIQLIVKLNYLLTTKNAQLILKTSHNFECAMVREGLAETSPDYIPKSITPEQDFKTIFKRETLCGIGATRVIIGVDYRFNDKISSLDIDVYASAGNGLTDGGPAFILLAHELIHGLHNLTGKARYNFRPFFQGPKYENDPIMQILYPKNSGFSYGPSAEEYWTIEGGVLCENSIRKEHGFFNRTGHVSAEPGSRAILDLYHVGLGRSYTEFDFIDFIDYFNKTEVRPEITEDDKIIARLLLLEKYSSLTYSPIDLIQIGKSIGYHQLKKTRLTLEKLNDLTGGKKESDVVLHNFLMVAPSNVAQLLIAISKNKEVNCDLEIDSELLAQALPTIQKINEMIRNAGFPDGLVNAFSHFAENIETKLTDSRSCNL